MLAAFFFARFRVAQRFQRCGKVSLFWRALAPEALIRFPGAPDAIVRGASGTAAGPSSAYPNTRAASFA